MRKKLIRFKEATERENIIQYDDERAKQIKNQWNPLFFKNESPITLELGCGKGEYTVGLAKIDSNRNFVGVDIKSERIWVGSTQAINENLTNVGFLRTNILDLEKFFGTKEIDEIWITFPDPRPKARDEKRRLTSPRFLTIYKNIIKPGGLLHLKTDNTALFEYSLDVLQKESKKVIDYTFDLYDSPLLEEHNGIRTRYEREFHEKGLSIKYLKCILW